MAGQGKTKREQLQQALAGLETVGANVLGGVLNMAPRKGSNAERYRYRYGDDNSKRFRRSVKAGLMAPGAGPMVPAQVD